MPDYINDEKKWNAAIKAFQKQYDKKPSSSKDYSIVTDIYKKMGGSFNNESLKTAESLTNSYEFRLCEMLENNFQEASIPTFVWDFVKKTVKSPISAGILAMIIFHFLKKHLSNDKVKNK